MSIKFKSWKIASVLALAVTIPLSSMGVATAAPMPSAAGLPVATSVAAKKSATYRTTANVNLRKGAGTEHRKIVTSQEGHRTHQDGQDPRQMVAGQVGQTHWLAQLDPCEGNGDSPQASGQTLTK